MRTGLVVGVGGFAGVDAGHVLPGEQGEGDLAAGQVLHPGWGEGRSRRGVGDACRRPRCPAPAR